MSNDSSDSFGFSEIDRRMNRIGGKCCTPGAATENQFEQDPNIRNGPKRGTPAGSMDGYEYPRAPIAETVSWGVPDDSGNGHSVRNRRNSMGLETQNRPDPPQPIDDVGNGRVAFSRKMTGGGCSGRSRVSGDSFNSPHGGLNPRRVRDQSLLPKSPHQT